VIGGKIEFEITTALVFGRIGDKKMGLHLDWNYSTLIAPENE
jgi:hypothetical protein